MTAIVMGGSLGGLNAAVWLREAGYDVRVFERSKDFLVSKGAGIVLNPSTVRYLKDVKNIDLADVSVHAKGLRFVRACSDDVDQPFPVHFASYNSLYRTLLTCLGQEYYHLDHEVIGFEQDSNGVNVRTGDEQVHRCNLLVCADGTTSDGRRLLGYEVKSSYAGYIAWRGTVKAEALRKGVRDSCTDWAMYHLRSDSHLLSYPIPLFESGDDDVEKHTYINWLWYRKVEAGPDLLEIMTDNSGKTRARSVPPGCVQEKHVKFLRECAESIPEPFRTTQKTMESPFIQAVYDHGIEKMVFGNVCILGDAAFSPRPHVAVATAKASEDACQLACALKECEGDQKKGLQRWEEKQLKLGKEVVRRSQELGTMLQSGNWPVGRALPFGLYAPGDSLFVAQQCQKGATRPETAGR